MLRIQVLVFYDDLATLGRDAPNGWARRLRIAARVVGWRRSWIMVKDKLRVLRSCFFYIVLFLSTIYCGASAVISYHLTRRNEKPHLCARLWANINLWAAGVKVGIEGLENIDPRLPYIYASNHQSLFDIFAVLGKLPVQFRWLAKEELFKIPILGPSMAAVGYIPIDRTDRKKAIESLNIAASKVEAGTSIVIFPEGTRSLDGVLQEFKKGGFILAIKSQQPIVPITISGSHGILPKSGDWVIHSGTIRMTVSPPIRTAGFTTRDREALMTAVREGIRKHLPRREGGLRADDEAAAERSDEPVGGI
jgi:1-acyl-sn-glycerol-3-phosphate acyltransferase